VGLVAALAAVPLGLIVVSILPATAATTRYEAENATIVDGAVESNHSGYSGTGFVNGTNVAGSYVEFTVNASAAGTATVGIRFANGTALGRPADIAVNGTTVLPSMSFPSTGSWDTWATSAVNVRVVSGTNRIRLTATSANGNPNLDFVDFEVTVPTVDYQAENATVSQGVVATNHAGYTGTGFVDFTNVAGSYVEFAVNAPKTLTYSLEFRYANGSTTAGDNRAMNVSVNGTVVTSANFPPTGGWDTWSTVTVNATLPAGTAAVRATATTATGGPNLDRLRVAGSDDTQPPSRPGPASCTGITSSSLTLNWGASTDNIGVIAYDVYEHGNKINEAAGNLTSQTQSGLAANTTYDLTVIARDAGGNASPASVAAACTTTSSSDTTPPTAPTNLTSSNLNATSVTLTWGASTDNVGVTAYKVRSGSTVYQTVTGNPPATSTTVTGLACDSPYTLTVVAADAGGNVSAPSNAVSFTTPTCSTDGGVPSSVTTISTGWTIPWGVAWLPDGQSALVTERGDFTDTGTEDGRVWKVALNGTKTRVGSVPNVVGTDGEGGLLGVAVDPNWVNNHFVYFFHTASEGNRIVRMTYNGTSLGSYTILLQGIQKNRYHNGGRLAFGPDGYLYATTGDAQMSSLAQETTSLNGKILRLTTSGQPAPGNPFNNYVYSYGHRNPQGLVFDRNGRLWESEFGNSAFDELNLIKVGKNYGWPTCEGTCTTSGMTNPVYQWPVDQASPSGITIVRNVIYMAALKGERLWRIPINGDTETVLAPSAYYVGTYGRLRTVVKVPGADQLWLTTTNSDNNGGQPDGADKIFRIAIT
jgi:glucose/arabinose dehydrogenase